VQAERDRPASWYVTNLPSYEPDQIIVVLAKEQEERRDAEQSVAALKRQLASIRETCVAIDSEIEQYRAAVSNLQRGAVRSTLHATYIHEPTYIEKDAERDILNKHAAQLEPELAVCESWLKCNIEGIEADQLLIRFSHIDEGNIDREFSFVLDVSTPSYNGEFSLVYAEQV
jgi:kinetochore protein Spc25